MGQILKSQETGCEGEGNRASFRTKKLKLALKLILDILLLALSGVQLSVGNIVASLALATSVSLIFNLNFSIGIIIIIGVRRYFHKLYHGMMALVIFFWLLWNSAITLASIRHTKAWIDFQYLKKVHRCILEKLCHHLLQLSATNKSSYCDVRVRERQT